MRFVSHLSHLVSCHPCDCSVTCMGSQTQQVNTQTGFLDQKSDLPIESDKSTRCHHKGTKPMEPSERAVFSCSPLVFSPEIDWFLLGWLDRWKNRWTLLIRHSRVGEGLCRYWHPSVNRQNRCIGLSVLTSTRFYFFCYSSTKTFHTYTQPTP